MLPEGVHDVSEAAIGARTLARLVIAALDQQKKYFKYRTREDLIESKRLEGELRKAAEEVLS